MEKSNNYESVSELEIAEIVDRVGLEAPRVADLGNWPEWMKPQAKESLVSRIPQGGKDAPGFDAGIACALDMIPRDKQELAAALHGAYTPEKVDQVREEIKSFHPDSETTWWLAACRLCLEGDTVNEIAFREQLKRFEELTGDPEARARTAQEEYEHMTKTFETNTYNGVPFGTLDGCMQGAYVAGYPFATMYADRYGIFFVGTYHDSLGLEDFQWSDEKDEKGRPKSGPVFGSKQFVKCANEEEFKRVINAAKARFPDMPKNN